MGAGAGLEFMLTNNNLSAKAEYMFTSVGSDRYFDFSRNVIQTSLNNSPGQGWRELSFLAVVWPRFQVPSVQKARRDGASGSFCTCASR